MINKEFFEKNDLIELTENEMMVIDGGYWASETESGNTGLGKFGGVGGKGKPSGGLGNM